MGAQGVGVAVVSAAARFRPRARLRRTLFFSDPAEAVSPTPACRWCLISSTSSTTTSTDTQRNFRRTRTSERPLSSTPSRSRQPKREATGASRRRSSTGPMVGGTRLIQLLLPLSLVEPDRVDLALVLDQFSSYAEQPPTPRTLPIVHTPSYRWSGPTATPGWLPDPRRTGSTSTLPRTRRTRASSSTPGRLRSSPHGVLDLVPKLGTDLSEARRT